MILLFHNKLLPEQPHSTLEQHPPRSKPTCIPLQIKEDNFNRKLVKIGKIDPSFLFALRLSLLTIAVLKYMLLGYMFCTVVVFVLSIYLASRRH